MVKNQRHMTGLVMLPCLNILELTKFCQLNWASYQLLQKYVNFKFLLEAWGIQLTDEQVEEIKISSTSALQVALKFLMIKSIIESQQIIGKRKVVERSVSLPDLKTL